MASVHLVFSTLSSPSIRLQFNLFFQFLSFGLFGKFRICVKSIKNIQNHLKLPCTSAKAATSWGAFSYCCGETRATACCCTVICVLDDNDVKSLTLSASCIFSVELDATDCVGSELPMFESENRIWKHIITIYFETFYNRQKKLEKKETNKLKSEFKS